MSNPEGVGIRTVVRGGGDFLFVSLMIGSPCFYRWAVRWRWSGSVLVSGESARDDPVPLEVGEQLREHAICLDERGEAVSPCLQCRPRNVPVGAEDGVREAPRDDVGIRVWLQVVLRDDAIPHRCLACHEFG